METACRKACSIRGPLAQLGPHPPSIARWLGLHRKPILMALSLTTPERGALVILTAQTISSSTIAGLSDPSVRPSTQELARCWLALARSDWLSTGGQPPREPWCPSAFSSGTCEASTLVPPLVPGASTGDLFGGAWRMGTLDQGDVNQQDGAAVVTAVVKSSTITLEHQHPATY
ncbi:hypothetical protein NCU07614 [Neurospora crassa OR74A]|uniref:Uncharacterized protein n=1 Tax=Neurospora crassa (strain ATCC 24698 / 74-OR23-1A / CBS 708.71 / DSM 1257 / FGSC 987) TaxID=367110 RepID=Q7SB40_NEUCR|nr:hypothetical protein NCU07614 [Neurospora crassa OR74A]EAA33612.1 hypothetical protein NCU07614 [Neurospora crassa OR74A]|eukprot:XP_962848.1 hypothetical protein NCU07614 [Neurospora crassa OR74A]